MSAVTASHLYCDGAGSGPPVVLVHGVGLDRSMWDWVVPDLVGSGHEVLRYDLLGHGDQPDEPGERTLADFVDQLRSVIASSDHASAHVVGSSLGALIALTTAAEHPDLLRSLIVTNMVFGRTEAEQAAVNHRLSLTESSGMGAVADLAIDRWFTADWQTEHVTETALIDARLRTTNLEAYLKAYRVFAATDVRRDGTAQRVECPTLAITGSLDPGSTPAMSRAAAKAVPNGTVEVLEGLRHLPSVEAPATFTETLTTWLTARSKTDPISSNR